MCYYNLGGGGIVIYFVELVLKESSIYEENLFFKVDIVVLVMWVMWYMICCIWFILYVLWIIEKGGVLLLL